MLCDARLMAFCHCVARTSDPPRRHHAARRTRQMYSLKTLRKLLNRKGLAVGLAGPRRADRVALAGRPPVRRTRARDINRPTPSTDAHFYRAVLRPRSACPRRRPIRPTVLSTFQLRRRGDQLFCDIADRLGPEIEIEIECCAVVGVVFVQRTN